MDWEGGQFKSPMAHYISTVLLASLQALNLFWLWNILRVAYRIVFFNVAEDDRSDNDEAEFEEEQRLDALSKSQSQSKSHQESSPKVLLNGHPVNGKAAPSSTTATDLRKQGTTNRKENVRRA